MTAQLDRDATAGGGTGNRCGIGSRMVAESSALQLTAARAMADDRRHEAS